MRGVPAYGFPEGTRDSRACERFFAIRAPSPMHSAASPPAHHTLPDSNTRGPAPGPPASLPSPTYIQLFRSSGRLYFPPPQTERDLPATPPGSRLLRTIGPESLLARGLSTARGFLRCNGELWTMNCRTLARIRKSMSSTYTLHHFFAAKGPDCQETSQGELRGSQGREFEHRSE